MPKPLFKLLLLTFITFIVRLSASAQLNVNFGVNSFSGCAPFKASFYNTTTGASDNATYLWDFGNGITSTEKNPANVFVENRAYTVTLTVYDCAKTASKTQRIAVYPAPSIDFTDSLLNGCLPLNVQFKAKTNPGDTTINSYYWYFGDYQYQGDKNLTQVTHTYTSGFTPQVALTVGNIYGCSTTITKSNFNTFYQPVTAAFSVSQSNLCVANSQAVFTNNTTGPGTLNYLWDFGDGVTSTQVSPSHAYKTKGSFPVKLTVTSSLGCTDTAKGNSTVNVANFTADFDVPATICTNSPILFTDKSTANNNGVKWVMDGQPAYPVYNYYYNTYNWQFNDTTTHSITLTETYGKCDVSKTKTVKAAATPVLNGFIANIGSVCAPPVTVSLQDTTNGAVKWEWYNNSNVPFSTKATASITFNSQQVYGITLKVTNAAGCTAQQIQNVDVSKPNVTIIAQGVTGSAGFFSCTTSAFIFSVTQGATIKTYNWDFGDGKTDNTATPKHQYTQEGTYTVTLKYVTSAGCSGTAEYKYIILSGKPKADFTTSDTVVCGNATINFLPAQQNSNWTYYWSFGDAGYYYNYSGQTTHQYNYDTTYTVSLIVQNGACRDTVVKKNYIRVKPGFIKITGQRNTCNGTRGDVTFTGSSKKTTQWIWDFGDGSKATFNTEKDTVVHTYQKTGTYTVKATSVNDKCLVSDVTATYVLVKQTPQLTITPTSVCGSNVSNMSVKNFDVNPAPNVYGYNIYKMEYVDSTQAPYPSSNNGYYITNSFTGTVNYLDYTKKGVYVILNSGYFNCLDTSVTAPLVLTRPAAGIAVGNNAVCFKSALVLKDSSVPATTSAIKQVKWSFGDGATADGSKGGSVSHQYASPGQYLVSVMVTDAAGCSDTSNKYVAVSGPKADFSLSQNPVSPNTTVYFYNNTNTYNAYNTAYTWLLPNGNTSHNSYESYLFTALGTDTIKLIASNNSITCADTAFKVVSVVKNAAFTYTVSSANNTTCPPVTASFKTTDVTLNGLTWDFGDGSRAYNDVSPVHVYYHPGIYKVVLSGYNAIYNAFSITDTIIVKGPVGAISTDKLTGCDSLNVELTAVVKDAANITWDFGDGITAKSTDTFCYHTYKVAGVYKPRLIVKDNAGCTDTSLLPCKIIIDNLQASISSKPPVICDSSLIHFVADVKSVAKDQLNEPLQYQWNFGNGNSYTTTNPDTAYYRYTGSGKQYVNFTVASSYGCSRTVTDTITVQPVSKASISGPNDACVNSGISFSGSATNAGAPLLFSWQFTGNIPTQSQQTPQPVTYTDSGIYNISLMVNNNGCIDTAYHLLHVHGGPAIQIAPKQPVVCLGDSVQLFANNADTYNWSGAGSISNTHIASPYIKPQISSWYHLVAENSFACQSLDSVFVQVALPFNIKTAGSTTNICAGNKGQLVVTGADKYKWITGAGLSDISIANPTFTGTVAQTYTVVGYDNYGCFTDTASVVVSIAANPSVTVTPHYTILNAGSNVQLNTQASADVVKYNWQPPDYLSCSNCPAPLSSPESPVVYKVTVTNKDGCVASDTAGIKIVCVSDLVHIPNAFTPNNDAKNDRFVLSGTGIKVIKHIAIFNRVGTILFERSNIGHDDFANSWDGSINGAPVPAGAYVYIARIECASGETFDYKGTIVLIR